MQREDWLKKANDLRLYAKQIEDIARARQADATISAREYAALTDALRNAIGVQRALLRVIDCNTPALTEPVTVK